MRHILVIANETVAGRSLIDAVKQRAGEGEEVLVTAICPVNQPNEGYVVYEDSRRASAGRRLDQTLQALRTSSIPAHGMVVETDPVAAVRDALVQLDPPVTEVIVSTHPEARSGWLRRNVVERIQDAAGDLPVEHVVADMGAEGERKKVLVIANETVIGSPLLDRIRARAEKGPATFLLVSPQSDLAQAAQPEAERRMRRALAELRAAGIEAHGQIAHPDPYTAGMHAVHDERVDEIIVSTFPQARSGWLRRDLVERLRKGTGLPVDHVVVEPEAVGAEA
jgi:hypothetical protein